MPRKGGNGRKRPADDNRESRWKEDADYLDIPVEPREHVEEAAEDWEPPLPPGPPSKRARTTWTPPRRQGGAGRRPPPRRGGESVSVRFTSLPAEYTYDMVMEMHGSFGLDVAAVEDLNFEPPQRMSNRGPTIRAITVRYANEESAVAARDTLFEQPVLNRAGDTLYLGAEVVVADGGRQGRRQHRPRSPETAVQRWNPPQRGGGRRPPGPDVIYPSAYISDVPVEYKESTMLKLHRACNVDETKVMAVKFLPPQEKQAETCCCIVRYLDQETADQAVAAIRGRPVQLRSGICKFFGAKPAKPARWMVELGITLPGQEPKALGDAARPPAIQNGGQEAEPNEADWCGQGKSCVGRVGMLLYEDVSTGTPFCEACWERFEQEDAKAVADAPGTEEYEEGQ
uniref:RRM domain-containing protein n=1 Tax=Alexandrium monilatum TaxID=311494 RepID=A0A7S4QDP2_9DINO|mmetsp:Transcript_103959/g.325296  ORF Transcript_103959/g.325296 Transcript_103959/m.325296 type:complete len:399 (+) Transcript_103959:108-1304(+)